MFQTIISILTVITIGGGFLAGLKAIFIFQDLRNDNLLGSKWKGTATMNDLKKFHSSTTDDSIKEKVGLLIRYLNISRIITWGGFCLIIISFLVYGLIFK